MVIITSSHPANRKAFQPIFKYKEYLGLPGDEFSLSYSDLFSIIDSLFRYLLVSTSSLLLRAAVELVNALYNFWLFLGLYIGFLRLI